MAPPRCLQWLTDHLQFGDALLPLARARLVDRVPLESTATVTGMSSTSNS